MAKAEYVNSMRNHFTKNNKIRDFQSHSGKVHALGWNNNGTRLASGSLDRIVNTFTLDSSGSKLVKEHSFKGHSESVDQLCWQPGHADIFCTTGGDGSLRVWDTRTRRTVSTLQLKGENINLAWSPDAECIALGNKEDLVSWVDRRTMKVQHSEQFKSEMNEISWNIPGDSFFLTTGSGCIYVYSYPELKLEMTMRAHPVNVICLQFDPTGRFFAVGSADALVSVWDARELACIRTLARLEWPVRTLGFSHDGQMVASASEDHFIDISEVETGEQVYQLNTRSSATFVLAWHPKQHLLAYTSEEKYERDRDQGMIKLFGLPSD